MKFKRANNESEAKEIMELQFKHDEDFMFLGSYFTSDNITSSTGNRLIMKEISQNIYL